MESQAKTIDKTMKTKPTPSTNQGETSQNNSKTIANPMKRKTNQ